LSNKSNTYRSSVLGAYGFMYKPINFPERHNSEVQLLATSMHEQIHDMLARQTTHGFIALFYNSYTEGNTISQKNTQKLNDAYVKMMQNAMAVHERYATFGTLDCNKLFSDISSNLPLEYKIWKKEANQLIPEKLRNKRLGRILVYSAALVALSPKIDADYSLSNEDFLLDILGKVSDVEDRWNQVSTWISDDMSLTRNIKTLAKKQDYSKFEIDLPIFFEDTLPILKKNGINKKDFEQKERNLIIKLVKHIDQNCPGLNGVTYYTDMLASIIKIRDKIVPFFRLEPILPNYLNITAIQFGDLQRIFQEEPLTGILDIKYNVNLAKNSDAFRRIVDHMFEHTKDFNSVGYVGDHLSENLKLQFSSHIRIDEYIYLQVNFLTNNFEYYRNRNVDCLYFFALKDFINSLKSIPLVHPLLIFASPYVYFDNLIINKYVNNLVDAGLKVFLIQPFNFLNLLEWRLERDLTFSVILVKIINIPSEYFFLINIRFGIEKIQYSHLCTRSTVLGFYELLHMQNLDISIVLEEKKEPSDTDWGQINFLKLSWRKGFLGGNS